MVSSEDQKLKEAREKLDQSQGFGKQRQQQAAEVERLRRERSQ